METTYQPKTLAEMLAGARDLGASSLLLNLLTRTAEIDAAITSPTDDDSHDRPPTGEDYNLLADAITDEVCAEIVRLRDAARAGREVSSTPAARWRENGEPDPHGDHYSPEKRATLAYGHLTDDEIANEVFMWSPPGCVGIGQGAKERIRWLSRCMEARAGIEAELLAALKDAVSWIEGMGIVPAGQGAESAAGQHLARLNATIARAEARS